MEHYQKQTVKLLDLAIHGKKLSDFKSISKWNEILSEANAHEISALIYSLYMG